MAVNFAPLSEEFRRMRPAYHVLADPHFFSETDDSGLGKLWASLRKVDWPMKLLVPGAMRSKACRLLGESGVEVVPFNDVGIEGFDAVCRIAFDLRLAMPRPRNVLVPSLMAAIWMGYDTVYVAGADHSWMRTLAVDDNNEVVAIQEHFYKESGQEQQRVSHEYKGYRLHQIVESMAIAFRSYHRIENYARVKGVAIYNVTPGSYIDAFERRRLPEYATK